MISRYTYQGLTWIDLESPSREEILHISEEHMLPKQVEEELFSITEQSQITPYTKFAHLTLHFPQEVQFVIGKHFIVTVHYESLSALQQCATLFEHMETLDQYKKINNGGELFTEMLQLLYQGSVKELTEIAQCISTLEKRLFKDKEETIIRVVSRTKNALITFKQKIGFQGIVLHTYAVISKQLFGPEYDSHAAVIIGSFKQLYSTIKGHERTLRAIQQTNDSMIAYKSHKTLKVLTIYVIVIIAISVLIFLRLHN